MFAIAKRHFYESLCAIHQCALKKGVATCGECSEIEQCSTVGAVFAHNPQARKNLTGK
ncbi:MAG: DUF3795 domain-containing protein [Bacteroidales bacterium]|nr:DUF3795 domain-containing protein [Bacteroidales bacterium]